MPSAPPSSASVPQLWLNLRNRWLRYLTPYDPDSPDAAHFRSLQLQPILWLTPWMICGTAFNVATVCWLFQATAGLPFVLLWGALVIGISLLGLHGWDSLRQGHWPDHCSARTLRRATRNAALTSLAWTAPMVLGYQHANSVDRTTLLLITEGMICAGTFALSSVPLASAAYMLIMTLGTLVGLLLAGWREHLLLLGLTVMYSAVVMATALYMARIFGARMEAEAENARQKQLVRLLLDDFEQHAQDWMWELDEQGALVQVSQRLAQYFGRRPQQLAGEDFVRIISHSLPRPTEEQRRAIAALGDALEDIQPFTQLQVPVMLAGQLHWWSLSGKRVVDERGMWRGWRGVGSDITRDRNYQEEMERLAHHDSLTGLANREQLQTRLQAFGDRPFTLQSIDLCGFAQINSAHGELVGDQVLQIVASRFRACVRQGDLLVRLQSDNFILVNWGALTEAAAASAANRLLATLRQPCTVDGLLVPVSACVGIVQVSPPVPELHDLLGRATVALETARTRGAGACRIWSADLAGPAATPAPTPVPDPVAD